MTTRQRLRSEETKQAILTAAGKMFTGRGFEFVTMREIAKEAGCSHTTIYIYFKDKEVLLHELSMAPLLELKDRFETIARQSELTPERKLQQISVAFIHFCLQNKSMYSVIFITKGTRVDQEPDLPINKLRFDLFNQLGHILQDCLQLQAHDERLLTCNRIFFYMLQGIVSTYSQTDEPLQDIMSRLHSTFEEAFDSLLIGFKSKLTNGG
ncbi:TetR/AcrR family transcriptional regulator [Paenibacillus harenae]|uniref:AcrR family transcriptional regulator n=1 Tax=Paenibacillus harenae TaxID=306543 RepID=A0ABT9UAR6_PAEHA|nr:TetR/AcrR family transcriptional regulator [Paenibacillus harenae]MDQ0062615.1 AcrR family transcriptional regulator [Paenibacillus harenae]MDQ0116108.1 AcrR family transcriptional regulator [Paenibacillus harenae]